MESLHMMRTLRAMAPHPGGPGTNVVPQQQDLQRLRDREPEAEAGTHVDLPRLWHPA